MTQKAQTEKAPIVFSSFFAARDFAAANVKGFPAWCVEETPRRGLFAIRLCPPDGPLADRNGNPTRRDTP